MSKLNEQSRWHDGIYQVSNNDVVRGGESGAINQQAAQLAGRTLYLKNRVDTLQDLAQSPFLIYDSPALAQAAIDAGTERRRFFDVRAANVANVFDVFENIAGQAIYTGTSTKSAAFIEAMARKIPDIPAEWLGAFLDAFGNVGAGLRDDGTWSAPAVEAQKSTVIDAAGNEALRISAYQGGLAIFDRDGNVMADMDRNGKVRIGSLETFNFIATGLDLAAAKVPPVGAFREDNLAALVEYVGLAGMPSAYGNKQQLPPGMTSRRLGTVLAPDAAIDYMAAMVESPVIWYDDADRLYHMVFTGYSGTNSKPGVGSVGHAVSSDLVNWTPDKQPLLAGSSIEGAPDKSGCTGPYMVKGDDGVYYLYYIGLPAPGYENGIKRLCLATAKTLGGPWERHGVMIDRSAAAPWRADDIYHASIVTRGGKFYCFINGKGKSKAGGDDSQGNERIGLAVANSLLGPWVVDDANSPLVTTKNDTWRSQKVGDPSIWRDGNLWYMQFFGYNGTAAYDSIAVTTDDEFPYGWQVHDTPTLSPALTAVNERTYTHKPFVLFSGGMKYHYYTGVGSRRVICLAVSGAGVDDRFMPGDDGRLRDVITPSVAGKAVDRYRSEIDGRHEIEVGVSSDMEYSISRRDSNGFDQLFGLRFDGKSVALGGTATLPANATNGFVYLPVVSDTPTGKPDGKPGGAPACIDIKNNRICIYISGAWRFAQLQGA
ncbi:hypothetical protein [Serratia surfactantfaciens]|uniref:hypothetical protein n=1 Tax=Serratia surfactantfaciens TaxID=2741499 RepID=UPI001B3C8425|nr:hypothetical protein [Serratia surfactantfaciens]